MTETHDAFGGVLGSLLLKLLTFLTAVALARWGRSADKGAQRVIVIVEPPRGAKPRRRHHRRR